MEMRAEKTLVGAKNRSRTSRLVEATIEILEMFACMIGSEPDAVESTAGAAPDAAEHHESRAQGLPR
ncbi:MAG: hypothetical protein ABIR16_07330 [Dokdonella sp.]